MISKSTDFYTRQDIWQAVIPSASSILTGTLPVSFSEFVQPLAERVFKGTPMPSRNAKVVKSFWDKFCQAQNADIRKAFSLNVESKISVKEIAALLSGTGWYDIYVFRYLTRSRWIGEQIPSSALVLLGEGDNDFDVSKALENRTESEKQAREDYYAAITEAGSEYSAKTKSISDKYTKLKKDASDVETTSETDFNKNKGALAQKYTSAIEEINKKEITEGYTQKDKQQELDNALIDYNNALHSLAQTYRISL